MNNIQEILEKNNINPSFQRIKVLKYLIDNRNHPTVEMIYSHLIKEIPTMSKTTIYNTLQTFVEKGIVDGLTISGYEARFDYKEKSHSHFMCKKCEKIIDIDSIKVPCHKGEIDGNKIDEVHYYFKGICEKCLKGGGNKNGY